MTRTWVPSTCLTASTPSASRTHCRRLPARAQLGTPPPAHGSPWPPPPVSSGCSAGSAGRARPPGPPPPQSLGPEHRRGKGLLRAGGTPGPRRPERPTCEAPSPWSPRPSRVSAVPRSAGVFSQLLRGQPHPPDGWGPLGEENESLGKTLSYGGSGSQGQASPLFLGEGPPGYTGGASGGHLQA